MNELVFYPEQASTFASQMDWLYLFLSAVTVLMTLIVFVLTLVFAVKYRRGSRADRTMKPHTGFGLEIAWSLPPLIVGIIVFFWGANLYAHIYYPPRDVMEIFVMGKQWMWHMQHPNGVRENNELHLPEGRDVKLTIISQDVIHSFFVPAFRIKRDALPGRYTTVWFRPTKVGKYHLFCTEYCGAKHAEMVGTVYVMKPADYERWLAETEQATRPRGATGGVAAAGAMNTPTISTNTGGDPLAVAGRQLYDQLGCQSCHGNPSRAPSHIDLAGAQVKLAGGQTVLADDNYLRESILRPNAKVVEGYQPVMPSYEGQLSEVQVRQLVAFLRAESKNTAKTGSTR